jgi:hypothetical protein
LEGRCIYLFAQQRLCYTDTVPCCNSSEDYTLATLWKRAQSFSSSVEGAPFSKLALSKLLVLKDRKAREDYFAQQAAFVMTEGRKDVNAVSG